MTGRLIKCSQSHINIIQQISIETFFESYGNENSPENMARYAASTFSIEKLRAELDNPDSSFYILLSNKEIAGYMKLNFGEKEYQKFGVPGLEIERIYIKSSFQGMGYGRQLMEKAINDARNKLKKKLWLGVWEKNENAITFYKHMGFEVVGSHLFMLGEDEQTDLLMAISL